MTDLEKIKQSLASAEVGKYASIYTQQREEAKRFAHAATQIWYLYRLTQIYSLDEIMQACREVCAHYPVPAMRTMGILEGSLNTQVARDFFVELGKITAKSQ